MEPTSKRAVDPAVSDSTNEDAGAPDARLSDFLSIGLRESQRPPVPSETRSERLAIPAAPLPKLPTEPRGSEATASSTNLPAERAGEPAEGSTALPAEPRANEATDASASPRAGSPTSEPVEESTSVPSEADGGDALADALVDRAAPAGDSTKLSDAPELDYEIPVGWSMRRRIVALAVVVVLLGVVAVWWPSRGGKLPPLPHGDVRDNTVHAVHEPAPPPPPAAEPPEPSSEIESEPALEEPNVPRSSSETGPEIAPSAGSPGGPSVARFPDLPRPVLIQLEQAQQEAKKKK